MCNFVLNSVTIFKLFRLLVVQKLRIVIGNSIFFIVNG